MAVWLCVCVRLPCGIESRVNTHVRLFPRWSAMNEWADSHIGLTTALVCVGVALIHGGNMERFVLTWFELSAWAIGQLLDKHCFTC